MIYSLICKKQHAQKDTWELVEGYSLYTPFTSFYDIDPEVLEKFNNQIKNVLIYLGIGLGITATSIPLWTGYNKNIKKAVELENETTTYSSSLNFSLNENGYGLAFKF